MASKLKPALLLTIYVVMIFALTSASAAEEINEIRTLMKVENAKRQESHNDEQSDEVALRRSQSDEASQADSDSSRNAHSSSQSDEVQQDEPQQKTLRRRSRIN
jgi:hypothetical protein